MVVGSVLLADGNANARLLSTMDRSRDNENVREGTNGLCSGVVHETLYCTTALGCESNSRCLWQKKV